MCFINEIVGCNSEQQRLTREVICASKDYFIPSHGKNTIETGRHCVFVGSTRNKEFLKKNSLNPDTMYWIINCGHIDENYIYDNFTDETVKQLWAEAYYMYKQDPDISKDIEKINKMIKNQNNNK